MQNYDVLKHNVSLLEHIKENNTLDLELSKAKEDLAFFETVKTKFDALYKLAQLLDSEDEENKKLGMIYFEKESEFDKALVGAIGCLNIDGHSGKTWNELWTENKKDRFNSALIKYAFANFIRETIYYWDTLADDWAWLIV